jgi:hypothetical protein
MRGEGGNFEQLAHYQCRWASFKNFLRSRGLDPARTRSQRHEILSASLSSYCYLPEAVKKLP